MIMTVHCKAIASFQDGELSMKLVRHKYFSSGGVLAIIDYMRVLCLKGTPFSGIQKGWECVTFGGVSFLQSRSYERNTYLGKNG